MEQLFISFRKNLRDMRAADGKTQKEVAGMLGISHQSYQAYESGKTLPTLENFLKLCLLFDTTPNDFFDLFL